jgi:hypothetical protein
MMGFSRPGDCAPAGEHNAANTAAAKSLVTSLDINAESEIEKSINRRERRERKGQRHNEKAPTGRKKKLLQSINLNHILAKPRLM